MKATVLVGLLVVCSAVSAADREFDQVVKAIESHYGVKPMHIPLLGLGNFFLKRARPAGVSGFRIAVFENLEDPRRDQADLDAIMNRFDDSNLHAIVQIHSRENSELTYIYMGNPGKSTRVLIASIENHEATVMEVKADAEALLRLLRDPDHIGDSLGVNRQDP